MNPDIADIVVVGGGASGLAAAYEGARAGSSVILIEKAADFGGMMNWCVGTVSAVNTPQQRRAGIQDSEQDHYEDLGIHAGSLAARDNIALRAVLTSNTTGMMRWLLELGIVFVGPLVDPPQRVARMHNVVPSSRSFAFHLARACRRAGVDLRLLTRCDSLIKTHGRIVGIKVQRPDATTQQLMARQAVILATGDYSNAPDLKTMFGAASVAEVNAVAPTSTGDGYRFGISAGGSVANGDIVRGPIMRFVPPAQSNWIQRIPPYRAIGIVIAWAMGVLPQRILRPFLMKFLTTVLGPSPALFTEGAILINDGGERFSDEHSAPASALALQKSGRAYIVFDQTFADKFAGWPNFVSTAPGIGYAYIDDYRRCRPDIFAMAKTPAELAAKLKWPADKFVAALNHYNDAERGVRPPIVSPNFFALGPVKSYVVFTEGGLRISENFEVLADGHPIPGLFAVGAVGQGGVLLEGHGHHLDWAFISGRLAGARCAALRREWNSTASF